MIFRHYSASPVLEILDRDQREHPRHAVGPKPWGFWLSVVGPDDWEGWCIDNEQQSWIEGHHIYDVTLSESANVLFLKHPYELDSFHREYAVTDALGWNSYPDWTRVASHYDGIVIAPYQWQRRLHAPVSDWYYGWDCASGVIWNAHAVAGLRWTGPAAALAGESTP